MADIKEVFNIEGSGRLFRTFALNFHFTPENAGPWFENSGLPKLAFVWPSFQGFLVIYHITPKQKYMVIKRVKFQ